MGEKFNYKGDEVGYGGLHDWIRIHYGKANHCNNDIAHKGKKFHWANISGNYLRNIKDWVQLCPSCHIKLDKKSCRIVCKNNHQVLGENLWINNRNDRVCKKCKKNNAHQEYIKHREDYIYRVTERRRNLA